MAKMDWDKARNVRREPAAEPVREPSGQELTFLTAKQSRLRREATARREHRWLLLDADHRKIAEVRAESAGGARELFEARGLTGAWLRKVADR